MTPTRRSVLIGAASLAAAPAFAQRRDPVVTTRYGRVRGRIDGGVHVFKGLRYGQDTGPQRFQPPLAPRPWTDVADAGAFGPSCPQRGDRHAPTSEDCLFLNIWTPGPDPRARRPVMVYLHGGAYSTGSAVDPLLDGRRLAARGDVVVVTLTHRLNAFGYLYLSRIDPRFADSGNAGQLDLLLALRWVRDNIAAFGGDPARVMVFGQSGGGAKIATMMAMPAADGLFHAAATMSGQQVTVSGPQNATARARAYLAALGDPTPDQLLTMPAERLVAALDATDPILGGSIYFGPVLDMRSLIRHPFWPNADPRSRHIPMILGNTRDETRGFFAPDHPTIAGLDWDNLPARLGPELRVDAHPEWVVAEYRRLFPSYDPEQLFFAATTASRSWRGQVIEAEERARAGAPAWVYQLDHGSPVQPWRGAPHGMDIPLVFGTLDAARSLSGTGPEVQQLSDRMADAIIALARTGNPNHHGLPHWPPYELERRATMIFDADTRVADDPRRAERELFARVPYIQPGT